MNVVLIATERFLIAEQEKGTQRFVPFFLPSKLDGQGIPFYVKLGDGTMIGWHRIVRNENEQNCVCELCSRNAETVRQNFATIDEGEFCH